MSALVPRYFYSIPLFICRSDGTLHKDFGLGVQRLEAYGSAIGLGFGVWGSGLCIRSGLNIRFNFVLRQQCGGFLLMVRDSAPKLRGPRIVLVG